MITRLCRRFKRWFLRLLGWRSPGVYVEEKVSSIGPPESCIIRSGHKKRSVKHYYIKAPFTFSTLGNGAWVKEEYFGYYTSNDLEKIKEKYSPIWKVWGENLIGDTR